MRWLFIASVSLVASGCFAVTDLGRFEAGDEPPPPPTSRDLDLTITNLVDIQNDQIEFRVVNAEDPGQLTIELRGIIDGVEPGMAGGFVNRLPIRLNRALDADSLYQIQLFADRNEDGVLDAGEPSFVAPIAGDASSAMIDATGTPIVFDEAPRQNGDLDVAISFTEMIPHVGDEQLFELIVFDVETSQAVGYFRLPDINDPDFDIRIPGVVSAGRQYEVQFYADADLDGRYDRELGLDHSWVRMYTAGAGGIVEDFPHDPVFQALDGL